MRKIMISILAMMMVIGLMVSCDNANITPEQKAEELVSVSFDEGTSRGLTGSIEAFDKSQYYWKYAAKKADDSGLISGQTPSYNAQGAVWIKKGSDNKSSGRGIDGTIRGFSQGYWNFTLYAYTDDAGNNLAYSGEVTGQKLQKSENGNTVVVRVAPIATGNGTLLVDTENIRLVPNQNSSLTDEQLATFSKEVIVEKFVNGNVPGNPINPISVGSTLYSLEAGTYKVTVKFVRNDGLTYAEGYAIATVYSNVKTIVSGYLDEITTDASFDSDAEVINKVAVSESVDAASITTAITSDLTLKDAPRDEIVKAVVPQNEAISILSAAYAVSEYKSISGATSNASLELTVDTTAASEDSVTLEIGMASKITTTVPASEGQEEIKYVESSAVKELNSYVNVTVNMQKGLSNVTVKHNNVAMVNSANPSDDPSPNYPGVYTYNPASGVLTIQTKNFSPFEVSYTPVKYIALKDGNKYSSLADAVNSITDSTGTTIKLISDATGNGVKVLEGRNIVFDLNGYTFNIDGTTVGSSGTETNGFQLLKDSNITIKNGTITSNKAKILIQNYSNLTLNNVVLDGTNLGGNSPTLSNNNGNIVINDSTIIAKEGGVAFDVYSFSSYTGTNVTVKGNSIIDGKIEIGRTNDAPLALTIEEGSLYGQIVVSKELNNYSLNCQDPSIATTSQLVAFEKMVNQRGYSYSGKTVKLTSDIDLTGIQWNPIGQTGATQFQGIFDGQGYTIRNMTIKNVDTSASCSSGFFGWIEDHGQGIIVKNVNFDNASVEGNHNVGVVVGYIYGTINNCKVSNSTVVANNANDDANGDKVGGIVGYVGEDAYIDNNTVTNCSITGNRDVGGIAGAVGNGVDSFQKNSVSYTDVKYYTDKSYASAGKIVSGRTGFTPNETNTANNVTIYKLVSTEEELVSSLNSGYVNDIIIMLNNNIIITNTLEINKSVKIDGNNYSLQPIKKIDMIKVTGSNIEVSIKNLNMYYWQYTGKDGIQCLADESKIIIDKVNIDSCFKALHFMDCDNTDVIISNSTLNSLYPFNVNGGDVKSFTVNNSVLNGWTSFAKPTNNVMIYQFSDCQFGKGYGYATVKPYGDTTFTGCTFSNDYFENLEGGIATGTETPISINFNSCKVGSSPLSAETLKNMFNYDITSGSSSGDSTIDDQYWYIDGQRISIITN